MSFEVAGSDYDRFMGRYSRLLGAAAGGLRFASRAGSA